MKRLLLLALLLLPACGSGVEATATSTVVNTPAPSVTPLLAASNEANKVAAAFKAAGLRVDTVAVAGGTTFKDSPSTGFAFNLWQQTNGGTLPMMSVVVASSPEQLAPWQNYFFEGSRGVFLRYRYLIRRNVMLVFSEAVTRDNQSLADWSQYWAVFAAMP